MESRFLFVMAVDENDHLSDLLGGLTEIAGEMECRCMLFVGKMRSTNDEKAEPARAVDQSDNRVAINPPEAVHQVNGHPSGFVRKQVGKTVISATDAEYPQNNDILAVGNAITKLGNIPIRALVVNPGCGEYVLAVSNANDASTVFYTMQEDAGRDATPEEKALRLNLSSTPNTSAIAAADVMNMPNQNIDVLVLVDPSESDFNSYSRHLRYGGLLILATSNGSSPDRPLHLANRLEDLTDSVSAMYRKNPAQETVAGG